jgi:hypothetical protein
MIIEINPNLISTLERLATEQNLTVEQCVVSNIEAYLAGQKQLHLIRTVTSDIPTYEPIITAKKEEIKQIKIAYDLAHPVEEKIIDITPEKQATSTDKIIK